MSGGRAGSGLQRCASWVESKGQSSTRPHQLGGGRRVLACLLPAGGRTCAGKEDAPRAIPITKGTGRQISEVGGPLFRKTRTIGATTGKQLFSQSQRPARRRRAGGLFLVRCCCCCPQARRKKPSSASHRPAWLVCCDQGRNHDSYTMQHRGSFADFRFERKGTTVAVAPKSLGCDGGDLSVQPSRVERQRARQLNATGAGEQGLWSRGSASW